ncbi:MULTISPECIES: hypothetical protein [Mycolicibacter]|uniref:Uncharacterized protein n=1 Tax=Mycolicibacter virginiensis TaxID=1795032 RepID=A0A9X7IMS5_9MYCO|nr:MULTISPECIES: hypothetical protein [Mycobacteriaceae]PQM52158.1 hypothetical protein C5U48_10850 [Mycolicibacter virginiensis]ULP49977.1 hypothetical protein MJO54_17235 [Mycolicibacter virginiensis]
MEAVEINAGPWYLRIPRADDRIDDRVPLADLGETDPDYVAKAESGWADDSRYLWAVCEPTTGELLAEVTLDPASGEIARRHRPGYSEAAVTGAQAVSRFAAGALGLTPVMTGVGGAASPDENPGQAADRQR